MGSNQGKQPHHADQGNKAWSRDEKRDNRRVKRLSRREQAIRDSVHSNASGHPYCTICKSFHSKETNDKDHDA